MKKYDVAIIGAGAAGLAAAGRAVARGRSVVIFDMGETPARKVAAAGGGRCNFTNMAAARDKYFGGNPDFVRGALARVTPADILQWVEGHGLQAIEKAPGQLFCRSGGADIVASLMSDAMGARIITNATIDNSKFKDGNFIITSNNIEFSATSLIVATGGISFASLGVSDAGYKIAKDFGHKIIPPRPALCAIDTKTFPTQWAGISIPVHITANGRNINGDMLFTHFGIGGPAVYSASVAPATSEIRINLMPGINMDEWLREMKRSAGRKSLFTILSEHMPKQIARYFAGEPRNMADFRDTDLINIAQRINSIVIPAGQWRHHGMAAAEVTFGGVDTCDISSKTMESKIQPGLFFAGEVMDIIGDLGGYNLHWAWASGRIAGENA